MFEFHFNPGDDDYPDYFSGPYETQLHALIAAEADLRQKRAEGRAHYNALDYYDIFCVVDDPDADERPDDERVCAAELNLLSAAMAGRPS